MSDNAVSDYATMDISADDNINVIHAAATTALPASTGGFSDDAAVSSGSTTNTAGGIGQQVNDVIISFSQLQFAQNAHTNENACDNIHDDDSSEDSFCSLESNDHSYGKLHDYEDVIEYEEEDEDMGASSDIGIEQRDEFEQCSDDDVDDTRYSCDSYSVESPFDDYDEEYDDNLEEIMDYEGDEETDDNDDAAVAEEEDEEVVTRALQNFQRAMTCVRLAVKLVNQTSARYQQDISDRDSSTRAIASLTSVVNTLHIGEQVNENEDLNEEDCNKEGREEYGIGDESNA